MNGTDEQNTLLFLFQIQSSCVLQTLVRYQKWGFFFYSLGDISRKMTEYLWLNLHVYLAWAGISWGIHFFYLPEWEWHHFYPFRSLYLTPNLLFFVLYLLLPVAHQSFAYPVSGTYLGEVIVPFFCFCTSFIFFWSISSQGQNDECIPKYREYLLRAFLVNVIFLCCSNSVYIFLVHISCFYLSSKIL